FPPILVGAVAVAAFGLVLLLGRRAWAGALAVVVAICPLVVERNRVIWTTCWDDLKPILHENAANDMAVLGLPDGGYFAGHPVAAGNPVHTSVRTLLPEDFDTLPEALRPRYLAVLVTPGSEVGANWRSYYVATIESWGYKSLAEGKYGALLQ